MSADLGTLKVGVQVDIKSLQDQLAEAEAEIKAFSSTAGNTDTKKFTKDVGDADTELKKVSTSSKKAGDDVDNSMKKAEKSTGGLLGGLTAIPKAMASLSSKSLMTLIDGNGIKGIGTAASETADELASVGPAGIAAGAAVVGLTVALGGFLGMVSAVGVALLLPMALLGGFAAAGAGIVMLAKSTGAFKVPDVSGAQKNVATATTANANAQLALQRAQNSVNAATKPSANQLLSLATAETKAKDAANALATAQANLAKAKAAPSSNPYTQLTSGLSGMESSLGKASIEPATQILSFIDTLIPKVQQLGLSFINTFEKDLPEVMPLAVFATNGLFKAIGSLGVPLNQLITWVSNNRVQLEQIASQIGAQVEPAFAGLLKNLEGIVTWVIANWPMIKLVVGSTFQAIGVIFQILGATIKLFMSTLILFENTNIAVSKAVGAAFQWLGNTWTQISGRMQSNFKVTGQWFSSLGTTANNVKNAIGGFFSGLGTNVSNAANTVAKDAGKIITTANNLIKILDKIPGVNIPLVGGLPAGNGGGAPSGRGAGGGHISGKSSGLGAGNANIGNLAHLVGTIGGQCVAIGQELITPKGRVPIEDIRPGDYVLTSTGFEVVEEWGVTSWSNDVLSIHTNSSHIRATPNHRFRIVNGTTNGFGFTRNFNRTLDSTRSPRKHVRLNSIKEFESFARHSGGPIVCDFLGGAIRNSNAPDIEEFCKPSDDIKVYASIYNTDGRSIIGTADVTFPFEDSCGPLDIVDWASGGAGNLREHFLNLGKAALAHIWRDLGGDVRSVSSIYGPDFQLLIAGPGGFTVLDRTGVRHFPYPIDNVKIGHYNPDSGLSGARITDGTLTFDNTGQPCKRADELVVGDLLILQDGTFEPVTEIIHDGYDTTFQITINKTHDYFVGSNGAKAASTKNCLAWLNSLGFNHMLPAANDLIPDITSHTAAPGEVFVMNIGEYGHTGLVTGPAVGGQVPVIDSNWSLNQVVQEHTIPASEIAGYIPWVSGSQVAGLSAGVTGPSITELIAKAIGGVANPGGLFGGLWKSITGGLAKYNPATGNPGSQKGMGLFDHGGWLMPGQAGINMTGRPEMVRSAAQEDGLRESIDSMHETMSRKLMGQVNINQAPNKSNKSLMADLQFASFATAI